MKRKIDTEAYDIIVRSLTRNEKKYLMRFLKEKQILIKYLFNLDCYFLLYKTPSANLNFARVISAPFQWFSTPQGTQFWINISDFFNDFERILIAHHEL